MPRVGIAAGLTLVLYASLCGLGLAQDPKSAIHAAPPSGAKGATLAPAVPSAGRELTAADLETFLDGEMPAQLQREDIAGAVIAVVKDGHVLFAKGYGFADVEKRKPVTPDATLFRPGSISKLFTWTSIMQLVGQGKLDLDRDVNDYLDFKFPVAFGKPITLNNIMTHTPGFEECVHDLFVADAAHLYPLDQYLKSHVPARIFPPGTTPAYSNYATATAGYIVQRISGKPFEQYVADNIFTPLGMKHTTFVQPLPDDLKDLMSGGYEKASQPAKPFEFVEAFPAGSVSTTAQDMTNFMLAHLQNGTFEGTQILKPETAQLMHARVFSPDDRLNGMAHGFYEETRNGHRIIGHGGDTQLFHSDLHLILDANVGFFVSYNSAGKGEISARTVLFESFLDRYFPYTPPPPAAKVADPAADNQMVAGLYVASRRFQTSFLKIAELFGQSTVTANSDNTISVDFLKSPNGVPKHFEEIAPLFYREVHGQDHVGFIRDANGNLQFQIDFPVFVFQRVSGGENKHLHYAVLIFSLSMMGLVVLLWPIAAIIRRHYGRTLELTSQERRLRLIVRLICLVDLLLLFGWLGALTLIQRPSTVNQLGPWAILLETVGSLAALGGLASVLYAFRTWSRPDRWIWTKIAEAMVAVACLGLAWFGITWNLIFNFKSHY